MHSQGHFSEMKATILIAILLSACGSSSNGDPIPNPAGRKRLTTSAVEGISIPEAVASHQNTAFRFTEILVSLKNTTDQVLCLNSFLSIELRNGSGTVVGSDDVAVLSSEHARVGSLTYPCILPAGKAYLWGMTEVNFSFLSSLSFKDIKTVARMAPEEFTSLVSGLETGTAHPQGTGNLDFTLRNAGNQALTVANAANFVCLSASGTPRTGGIVLLRGGAQAGDRTATLAVGEEVTATGTLLEDDDEIERCEAFPEPEEA